MLGNFTICVKQTREEPDAQQLHEDAGTGI